MIDFVTKIENKLQFRNSYYLLFGILNGAILMNFHKIYLDRPFFFTLLILSTLYTILRPKNWFSILSSCSLSVFLMIELYPRIGNHSTILLFGSLIVLALFVLKSFSSKQLLNTNFLSYFFRIVTVTIYFYTGFHKLNTDFLNPCVSCVNGINEYTLSNIFGNSFKITDSLSRIFQITALIVECIVPFGILFHVTRKYSVLILLLFHSYLSLSYFADFSSVGLFLLIGCIIDFEETAFTKKTILTLQIYLGMIILAVLLPIFLHYTTVPSLQHRFLQGLVFVSGYLLFFIYFLKNHSIKYFYFKKAYFTRLLLLFLTISCWTLKAYVGLGNTSNLTMFSNLVTEKSKSNHLLINTQKTKIFDFEEDSVYIIKIDNPNPNSNEERNGFKIPVVEFRFLVNYWIKYYDKPIACELVYKGKKYNFKDIKTSEFKNCKWWYKYLHFRKIQTTSPNECRW